MDASFRKYWFSGKAELNSYDLKQARYGELHRGKAVLIFVTEEFLKDKQVKFEGGAGPREAVLKLNSTRKFLTGMYPYSIMSSAFVPLRGNGVGPVPKVTMSMQEWCGHVFTQLNRRGGRFQVQSYSYFEKEGDRSFKIGDAVLEDELWVRLRVRPATLPVGRIQVVPALRVLRLLHQPLRAQQAEAKLTRKGSQQTYRLNYPDLKRTLEIDFEAGFPHRILGWREVYRSGWGKRARVLKSEARLRRTYRSDYWARHRNRDRKLRRKLGLPAG